MWSLFKKEIRENTKFLSGGLVTLFILLEIGAHRRGWTVLLSGIVWGRTVPGSAVRNDGIAPLLGGPLPVSEWFLACTIAALGICGFQIVGERIRGTLPLLAHLPVSGRRIVLTKLLAGCAMYAILLLPLGLALVGRLSVPGVYPGPFCLKASTSLVWPFLAGILIYFTAFAADLRPARWYATKWLLLFAALPAVVAVFVLNVYWNMYRVNWSYDWPEADGWPGQALVTAVSALVYLLLLGLIFWAILDQQRKAEY